MDALKGEAETLGLAVNLKLADVPSLHGVPRSIGSGTPRNVYAALGIGFGLGNPFGASTAPRCQRDSSAGDGLAGGVKGPAITLIG